MKLLLAAGAKVDLPTVNGITPLLAAAGVGSSGLDTRGRYKTQAQAVAAVKLLLDAGADVGERDRSGITALHGAAGEGWNSLVSVLAEHHADLFAKDLRGRIPVDLTLGSSSASGRGGATPPRPETEALLRRLMAAAQPASAAL